MGRFYKTASANPIDYMYQLNVPLMEKVIEANDAQITANLGQMDQARSLSNNFEHLGDDDQAALAKGLEYTQRIDAATDAIRKNPNNWRGQMEPIRKLTRDLTDDYTKGGISKMRGNYKTIADTNAAIDKMLEKGTLDPTTANAYKAHFINEWRKKNGGKGTEYNPQTGEYNIASAFTPAANINVEERLGKEIDKIKADKGKYQVSTTDGSENYFNDTTQKWERVTPEKIIGIAMSRLRGDTELQNYIREREGVGLIKNGFTNPYNYTPKKWSPEELAKYEADQRALTTIKDPIKRQQAKDALDKATVARNAEQQMEWNNEAFLAGPLQALVGRYAYDNRETEQKLRNNVLGMQKWNAAEKVREFGLNRADKLADVAYQKEQDVKEWAFKEKQEANKVAAEAAKLEAAKAKAAAAAGIKPTATTTPAEIPTETTVGQSSILNYYKEGFTIGDKIDSLNKENEDNRVQVNKNVSAIQTITKGRKDEELSPTELAQVETLRTSTNNLFKKTEQNQAQLANNRAVYSARADATTRNMTPEQKQIWDTYHSENMYGMQADEGTTAADFQKLLPGKASPAYLKLKKDVAEEERQNDLKRTYVGRVNIHAKADELKRVNEALQLGTQNAYRWRQNMQNTSLADKSLNLGAKDAADLGTTLTNNATGLQMYDALNREASIEAGGDNLSFQGDKLQNYLKANGGNIQVVRVVKTPGKEGVAGGQPVAIIKITGNKKIDATQEYKVPLPSHLQQAMIAPLLKSSKKDVAQLAGDVINPIEQQARNLFLAPASTEGLAPGASLPTQEGTIQVGTQQLPVRVEPITNPNGGKDYMVSMIYDGKWELIDFPGLKKKGLVDSPEQFSQLLAEVMKPEEPAKPAKK